MPSTVLLRAAAATALGLGIADLLVLNVVLGPRAFADEAPMRPLEVARDVPPTAPTTVPLPPVPSSAYVEPREEKPPSPELVDVRVYFATLSSTLNADALTTLQQAVAKVGPSATFTLEGHADVRGAEGLNLSLSKSRATAVADELSRLGVARTRITVDFVGSAGASPSGELWRDRRVDLRIEGARK
jgi:outer membrane protein OmpA-like peptidoglycan-associated protein